MSLRLKTPNEKMLELLIMEEEQVRMSKEYQDSCTAVKHIPNGWLTVTSNVQRKIAHKFGFDDELSCDVTCNIMRRAHVIYPNNKIFATIPVQVRNNKAQKGVLKVGDSLPDIKLHNMLDNVVQLHQLMTSMTVIFAGSQTWQPLRAMMHLLNDFYKEKQYNIFIIYIEEAHAADVWNIGESAGVLNNQHKTITDRINCAQKLSNEFKLDIPIYCDNMNNDFERVFAAWPTRYFVVKDGKIIMISEPSDSEINIVQLFEFFKTQ